MTKQTAVDFFNRATGLLIIEAINSNPNGDPDKESDPRLRDDQRGEISPVSFKRKLRDLVEIKEGPVWQTIANGLNPEEFMISESRHIDLKTMRKLNEEEFTKKYWDGRVFGNTELEKGRDIPVKTGVVQFGLGLSIAPLDIARMTTTNPAVQEDKSRGMAPLAYRVVRHGLYCMPFFINPTAASKTKCTQEDIDLMTKVIPYAYAHTASYIRSNVHILHAWYMVHKSPLGSCSDFKLIDALTPTKIKDAEKPSTSRNDYNIPIELPKELRDKLSSFEDLMEQLA